MWSTYWNFILYVLNKFVNFMFTTTLFGLPFSIGYIFIVPVLFRIMIFALVPSVNVRREKRAREKRFSRGKNKNP